MNTYRSFLLVILILCLGVGCAAPMVIVDGAPAPTHIYSFKNLQTGISIWYENVQQVEKREGSETLVDLIYLPDNVEISIDDKTISLSILVRILNPDKTEYSVWEVYSLQFPNDTYPYDVSHCIYNGSLSRQELSVPVPIKKAPKGTYVIEIHNKKNEPLFKIGNLRFYSTMEESL